jgi:DNA-binding NarL/FixJ family response regulator
MDPGFDFVGSCTREGLSWLVQVRRPDVLLVDGRIKRPLELCSRVEREGFPRIILLAEEAKDLAEFRDLWKMAALEAGARGVLGLGSMAQDLADAVRAVHGGQLWGPRAVVASVLERRARSSEETEDGEAEGPALRYAYN